MPEVVLDAKGLEKAADAFRKIPEKFERTMRLAMKSSIRDIREHARGNHRFVSRSGNLENAISSEVFDDPISGMIFLDTGQAPYGFWVHKGTKPHAIFPKNKKVLRWAQGGDFIFSKNVLHPGTKPDPFLQGALEAKQDDVAGRFVSAMKRMIKEAGV